ncbi:MAG: hypothetical protein WBD25_00935 [Terriglobales bacterium]|jgi:hypothetical protein
MRRIAIMLAGFVILLTLGATAQESRSGISLQGTGFFTKDLIEDIDVDLSKLLLNV